MWFVIAGTAAAVAVFCVLAGRWMNTPEGKHAIPRAAVPADDGSGWAAELKADLGGWTATEWLDLDAAHRDVPGGVCLIVPRQSGKDGPWADDGTFSGS